MQAFFISQFFASLAPFWPILLQGSLTKVLFFSKGCWQDSEHIKETDTTSQIYASRD